VGIAGLFVETHFDPNNALSDGPSMIPLHVMRDFMITMQKFDALAKETKYQDMSC
jgi:2-dehydro-3-deoxyphosphooctonate aldolase (KDO 8-P synthase)